MSDPLDNFGSHVRSLHYTLALVSVALLLAAFGSPDDSLDRAIRDARHLARLDSTGVWESELLDSLLPPQMQSLLSAGPFVVQLPAIPSRRLFAPIEVALFVRPTRNALFFFADTSSDSTSSPLDNEASLDVPANVGQLKQLWGALAHLRICQATPDTSFAFAAFAPRGDSVSVQDTLRLTLRSAPALRAALEGKTIHVDRLGTAVSAKTLQLARVPKRYRIAWESLPEVGLTTDMRPYRVAGRDSSVSRTIMPRFVIPSTCRFERIPAQEWLADRASASWWTEGSFASSFPELTSAAQYLDSLPVAEVVQTLVARREQPAGNVEIAGLKVPIRLLSQWGLLVLLGLQAGFLLNLRALLEHSPPFALGYSYPWLGFYSDRWSRVALYLTAIVLPALATGGLAVKGFRVFSRSSDRMIVVAFATMLFFLLCWSAATLHKMAARTAGSATEPPGK
jgi:hypothetical protein